MTPPERHHWPEGLSKAVHQTLKDRLPYKSQSQHLEDLVDVLMEALGRGELSVNFDSTPPHSHLKDAGWPNVHRQELMNSGWLEGDNSPMILDGDQLSWRRWQMSMQTIIKSLLNREKTAHHVFESQANLSEIDASLNLNPEQKAAVYAIAQHQIILLSGGPGTGKTSTILQMLRQAFLLNKELRIALAAPTGKAARRLQVSIHRGFESIETHQKQLIANVPCTTLHRLLQAQRFGFSINNQKPLQLDLLVVDEMSMVDLNLMQALMNALPSRCQLILVGDPAQLPPVGSGAVWHRLQGKEIRKQFGNGAIELKQSYRSKGALARLTHSLRTKGLNTFWENLEHLSSEEQKVIHHRCRIDSLPTVVIERVRSHLKELNQFSVQLSKNISSADASETYKVGENALEAIEHDARKIMGRLDKLMVLCPRRRGRWSVDDVNHSVIGAELEAGISNWPLGLPIMCGENEPELGVSNGDIGLIVGEGVSRRILFRIVTESGVLRSRLLHPARFRALEPALAITIHKAQGSEADQVMVLWPKVPNQDAETIYPGSNEDYERRLLYTAITRAKDQLDLITPTEKEHPIE